MMTQLLILATIVIIIAGIGAAIVWHRRQKQQPQPGAVSSATTPLVVCQAQLYIGNLAYDIAEPDLRKFFVSYGEIADIRIVKNNRTGRSKGFAFVTYRDISEAQKALAAHGKQLSGRRLVVRMAKPR